LNVRGCSTVSRARFTPSGNPITIGRNNATDED
jgi:hypothetical protein